jgi:SmpA / OmlA family
MNQVTRTSIASLLNRRRLLLLALLLIAGLVAAVLLFPHRRVVTQEYLERVNPGMTREQVEALLGKPFEVVSAARPNGPPSLVYCDETFWAGSKDVLIVNFNENGRAAGREILWARPDPRSLSEKLRDQMYYLRMKLGW